MVHPAQHSATPATEWRPSAPEARRLAAAIRSERLTVVIGSPQTQVTALLTGGVFPLLGRRSVDALGAEGATVLPFPERRQQHGSPCAEILVLADVSHDRTLAALGSRFEAAVVAAGVPRSIFPDGRLAERIEAVTEECGGRFLFLLDGFDALLDGADDGPESALITELVVILNRPLAANLLLAIRDNAARVPLEALFARLHGSAPTVLELAEEDPEPEPGSPCFTESVPSPTPRPEPIGTTPPWAQPPVERRPRRRGAVAAAVCAAVMVFAWGVWPSRGSDASSSGLAAVATAAAPATAVAPAALSPAFDLLVETEGERAPRLAAELAAALGNVLPRTVQQSTTTLVGASAERPRLAIARYDELRAAAEAGRPGTSPIQVLAPLPAEVVYVVVRNDGPLRRLGDLRGRRLNLGVAEGGRATTGRLLYRQMFGAAPPPHPAATLGAAAALQALAGNGAIDAVLLVGASGRAQLVALPDAAQSMLRLLAASPDDPASRKALQLYLPARADGIGATPVESLASISFLVAADARPQSEHAALVRSLCGQLDRLQREGDPAWRDVRAGQQLPIALRHLDKRVIETAWAQCTAAPSPTTSVSFR